MKKILIVIIAICNIIGCTPIDGLGNKFKTQPETIDVPAEGGTYIIKSSSDRIALVTIQFGPEGRLELLKDVGWRSHKTDQLEVNIELSDIEKQWPARIIITLAPNTTGSKRFLDVCLHDSDYFQSITLTQAAE